MSSELVINVASSEINIALLENKKLIELNKEKTSLQYSVGDIYLGRVKKILPGLNAAFIDIGYEKNAFLHYLDLGSQFASLKKYLKIALSSGNNVPALSKFNLLPDIKKEGKISGILKPGEYILVQIAKEPISTKGHRLSAEISIAGRNLILLPFSNRVSVSQKVTVREEKERLKNLLRSIKPNNYGVIVRTVAETKKVIDFDHELKDLIKKWEYALKSIVNITPPKLVIGELDRTSTILRDILNASFSNIYINNLEAYQEVKHYIKSIAPEKEKIVKHYEGILPIFDELGIEKQIKSLFGRKVSCKNGVYLVIEHTEALHTIDVNSGTRSGSCDDQEKNAFEVNLIAAEEIARQLRLRDMGGIIVIDFIDIHNAINRKEIFQKMQDFMSKDRAKHNILPLSKFGLMQITRQRVRPEMQVQTLEICPTCHDSGKITSSIVFIDELENKLQYLIGKTKINFVTLNVHPYIAAFIEQGYKSVKKKWKKKYNIKIKVLPIISFTLLEYSFLDKNGEEMVV